MKATTAVQRRMDRLLEPGWRWRATAMASPTPTRVYLVPWWQVGVVDVDPRAFHARVDVVVVVHVSNRAATPDTCVAV